jgi:hypothetical protein
VLVDVLEDDDVGGVVDIVEVALVEPIVVGVELVAVVELDAGVDEVEDVVIWV